VIEQDFQRGRIERPIAVGSCRSPAFHLPDLGGLNVSWSLLKDRTALLERLESHRRWLDQAHRGGHLEAWDASRHQAMRLLFTTRQRKSNAFDLNQEPDRFRDLYGREEWGQEFLVARRLVQAGVRMVQVNPRGWDTPAPLSPDRLRSLRHCQRPPETVSGDLSD
jgi:hypothetical protein